MWWAVNLDGMAMAAKDRHKELLAEAQKQQQLHRLIPQASLTQSLRKHLRRNRSEGSSATVLRPAATS
jgi:hypothetical protein